MNYFIVNKKDRMIWADWPVPKEHENVANKIAFDTRPHYPYSTELNWMEGQRVEEGKDFELKERMNDQLQVFITAVPLPSKDKEEKTERMNKSLEEMSDGEILEAVSKILIQVFKRSNCSSHIRTTITVSGTNEKYELTFLELTKDKVVVSYEPNKPSE